jgi:hypothetical protein
MDVSVWKPMGKRLRIKIENSQNTILVEKPNKTNHNVVPNPKIIPENTGIKSLDKEVCFLVWAAMTSFTIKIVRHCITSRNTAPAWATGRETVEQRELTLGTT